MRTRFRLALGIASFLGLGLGLAFTLSQGWRFLLRAAYEEARILLRRRSLENLLRDPEVSAQRKAQLALVQRLREFAQRDLGLAVGGTYAHFSEVGRDTLLLVLSASPSIKLEEYLWQFPLVGAFPYKGFFDPGAARQEARRLEERGFDTFLRPAAAFSTLGWLPDPLLSTALSPDLVQLAATVLHELAHNTLFAKGKVVFNESFASFVGYRGAERFFLITGDSAAAAGAGAIWRDEKRLGSFFQDLADTLRSTYALALPRDSILALKARVLATAKERLLDHVAQDLEVYDGRRLAQEEFNNARVVAALVYRTGLERFDAVLAASGNDLRLAIERIAGAISSHPEEDPFRLLETLSAPAAVPPPQPGSEQSCRQPCARQGSAFLPDRVPFGTPSAFCSGARC